MSYTTDKRALAIGITYRLFEGKYDADRMADFMSRPGFEGYQYDYTARQIIPDSRHWIPFYSTLDYSKKIAPFSVAKTVDVCRPIETLIEKARWAREGKLSYLYISCHGFEVKVEKPGGGKKMIRGLYFGHDGNRGYAYGFDYLSKNLFVYFDVIIIDACFAGGAKHASRYEMPTAMAEQALPGNKPHVKAFELDESETKPEYMFSEAVTPPDQTIIVATRQSKPAYASILGGPGRVGNWHTNYNSLFTSCFIGALRAGLIIAPGYKPYRGLNKIMQNTNRKMDVLKKIWPGVSVPNCSYTGEGRRYIFEE